MDEFLSMDLALAMISANEAISFFDEFYDKRNGYAAAYEAVKFEAPDSLGNRSRSGTVFGKDVSASLSSKASMGEKFKYHATSMLIHIYNAIAKIFSVIIEVVKTIGRVIIAPFKWLYKAITGGEIGKSAQKEIEDAVNKYKKDASKHLENIIKTDESLLNTADYLMLKMFPALNRLTVPIVGAATFGEKTYKKQDVDSLKDLNERFKTQVSDGDSRVKQSINLIKDIIDKASSEVSKIRSRRHKELEDIKGDTREWVLCYLINPSIFDTLGKLSANVEKSASNALEKTKKLAAKSKDEAADSRAVQTAKTCNEIANSCLQAVRIYRDSLIIMKVAPGAESTADGDNKKEK